MPAPLKELGFRDSIFTDKAIGYFVNVIFEEASFENVVFHGKILFNKSKFTRESERQGFFTNGMTNIFKTSLFRVC
jgi:hypothetical protein